MANSQCSFTCPNCGADVTAGVPGTTDCPSSSCQFHFRLFSKRHKDEAHGFYVSEPSGTLKHLRQASDGRWFVAYSDKVEPFIAQNLLDLIDPKALQTIQVGLSERLKRPMTILLRFTERPEEESSEEFPIRIIEEDGNIFGRVDPINPMAYFAERCKQIWHHCEGEKNCLFCDIETALEIMNSPNPKSVRRPCWAGLIDYAIPVVINDFVTAVFFTGQIRWTDPEGQRALEEGSERASKLLSMSKRELLALADDSDQLRADKSRLEQLMREYESVVKTISDVAENRYWAERRVRESDFLTEVFASFAVVQSEETLWQVVGLVLQRLNEFSFFRYSAFLLSTEEAPDQFVAKASAGIELDAMQTLELTNDQANAVFGKEALFAVSERGTMTNQSLLAKLEHSLGVSTSDCLFLFPSQLGAKHRGIILLGERTQVVPGVRVAAAASRRRKGFLERVAHEMMMEVLNRLTISELTRTLQEKEDLMATAGHTLVAPLVSAYGKSERLVSLAPTDDPQRVIANLAQIHKLCESLDEDILQSVRKTRSFMFFTTIETEAESYRFDREVSVAGILKECASGFRYLALRRGISIAVAAPDDIPRAHFDGEKLEMAFANLLDNAIKYSHDGKKIKVAVSYDPGEETYMISVSDFGLGISESECGKVFEKYYRSAIKDPRRYVPGTGIGLAVAKQIIAKHNGTIWVTSTQGRSKTGAASSRAEGFNTTFCVRIHKKRKQLQ